MHELFCICGKKLGTPIEELGLSNRALNCLERREIEYVEQLLGLTDRELLRFRNMGRVTLSEIKEKCNQYTHK